MTGMPKADVADIETLAATGGPRRSDFNGRLAYVNSKLCNLWFTYELARRIEQAGLSTEARPLSVNAYDPGLVPGSGLARDYPPVLRFVRNRTSVVDGRAVAGAHELAALVGPARLVDEKEHGAEPALFLVCVGERCH